MTTVQITIKRANVLDDMKVKSHAETAVIADPTERYIAELGSEKEEEAQQCITDASVEVTSVLRQSLKETGSNDTVDDDYDDSIDIVYSMDCTSRRAAGLGDSLMKAIHAYIVDSALNKFYISVGRADFAERHGSKLAAEIMVIRKLLHTKFKPVYTS